MSRLRSAVLGTIAWVLVVLTCATGVWFVIDRVGRTVLSPAPVARGAREIPTDGPGTAYRTGEPTPATIPSAVSPPASSPATPSTPATASTTAAPPPTSTHPTPAPRPPSPPPAPAPPRASSPPTSTSDAVAVAGGRVGAACTGSQISLRFATPESGWSFTVETEADHVAVHFIATAGTGQTEVSAHCVNGAPVFDTSETGTSTDS